MKFLKRLYNSIPFKKQIFSFLKIFLKLPPNIYQHLHFKGVFKVKIDRKRFFLIQHYGFLIENEVFWNGIKDGFEKQSINLWIKLCEDAKVIVDIGANTGIYSLVAKAINPTAIVYALEPVQRVFSKLQKNIELNNFDIIALAEAASNEDGKAKIYDIPNTEHTYSVTVNRNSYLPDTPVIEVDIRTIKLDTLIEKYNIEKIDLLKIDVETHEPEVIAGYLKYIHLHKPIILIEILNDDIGAKVESLVSALGYLYFNIDENSGIRKVDTITQSDYFNYLLCDYAQAQHLKLI